MTGIIPLLLSALLLAGCSGYRQLGNTDAIAIDPRMPQDATEAILAGLDQWSAATGGKVALRVRVGYPDGDASISLGDLSSLGIDASTDITATDPPRITVDAEQTGAANIEETVMHELGHAFGLEAHEDGTLMRLIGWGGPVVDARTLVRWEQLQ